MLKSHYKDMIRKNIIFLFLAVGIFISGGQTMAASLGDQVNFYVQPVYDANGRSQVPATLRVVGNNAYFYVDNNWWASLSSQEQVQKFNDLNNLSAEFDGNIYPTLRRVLGNEWRPGIDSDERISILFHPMAGDASGYFNPNDERPKSETPASNVREMVYLNTKNIGSSLAKSFLAHEFQHLISFYQKDKLVGAPEETWLNELRSELSPTLCGYDNALVGSYLENRVKNFLDKPYDSLTEWKNTINDYGVVNLFGQYLVGRYGSSILGESLKDSKTGIVSLNNALGRLGYNTNFSQIFTDWTIASYANDCSLGQSFCYNSESLKAFKVTPLVNFIPFVGNSQFSVANTTSDWAGNWYKFTGGHDALKIEFQASAGLNFRVPYIVTSSDKKNTLNFISLDNSNRGTIYVPNFGTKNSSLVIIPSTQQKISGFSSSDPYYQFSWTVSTILNSEIPEAANSVAIPDGALIRLKGDAKVYVVFGKFKRWIQSPAIFNMYGHLRWENIMDVGKEDVNAYQETFLVREINDYKVYKIENGKKRWLNISGTQFVARGYKWEEISIINQKERDYYPIGAQIL